MTLFTPIFITTAALVATFASALPANSGKLSFYKFTGNKEMKEGSYSVEYDDVGTPSINYTPFSSDAARRSTASLDRPTNNTKITGEGVLVARKAGCDNIELNHTNTDNANAELQRICGGGEYGTKWIISDDVVAFYCQYGQEAKCNTGSSKGVNKMITDECGLYKAGSYRGHGYAYGYTKPSEHDFCNIKLF
ncbi:hypothetical protein PG997_008133 [Apiospora hydei]|uniref:Uncharacterized protein n=1 Tax=Apiospora hydei TaxID=1337664 RepID=A0ABR1WCX5_9PEZI